MQLACETCGRSYPAGTGSDGVQLVPFPDGLTQLLMQADRVVEAEFDALVRKIAAVLASRPRFVGSGRMSTTDQGAIGGDITGHAVPQAQ